MERTELKMYRLPDTKVWKALFVVYIFVMLLVSRDTMITGSIIGVETAQYINLFLMVVAGISFVIVNRHNLKEIFIDPRMLIIIVSTIIILLPMLVKQDWQLMYFSVLMCLYFAVFLTYFISYQQIAKVFLLIISLLSIYSLFANYAWKPLVVAGFLQVPTFINSGGIEHYNFGLCFARAWSWYHRNYGLFREPGVYQFFILVALLLNNYSVVWKRDSVLWIINIVLLITMLSTFATGGLIEIVLFFLVLFLDKEYYSKKYIRRITAIILLLLIIIMIYSWSTKNNIYLSVKDMIVKLFNFDPKSSGGARYDAIITDIRIFFKKPLFGEKLETVLYAVDHNTTSTMLMFSGFGVLGGLFHVVGWVAFVWEKNRKTWVNLALLLIMFMSFNTQNLIADVFFWLFPMMALVEKGLPLLRLELFYKKA